MVYDNSAVGWSWPAFNNITFDCIAKMKLLQTQNEIFSVGLANNAGTDKIIISYDTTQNDTQFMGTCVAGGVPTRKSTNVNVDTSYHIFRIRAVTAGTILFSIDGSAEISINTNVPTGLLEPITSMVNAGTNPAVEARIDFFRCYAAFSRFP